MPPKIRYSQTATESWINGRGQTTELISWDLSRTLSAAPTPAWRLSIAQLEGAAEFSPIPQVRRIFLPIGTSVLLTVNGTRHPVPDHTITEFAGDDVVHLLDLDPRPGHAINLMVRDIWAPSSISFAVGSTADDAFPTCLVAVALETAGGVDLFDVVTPGSPELGDRSFAVAALHVHQGAVSGRAGSSTARAR